MRQQSSFADLRLNLQSGDQANESFWPSFTDIMTVIVMIFLIAMVVLLMRNMELIDQLRTTMEAERSSAELARTTNEEKATIAMRLIKAENELSRLHLQMMHMEENSTKQSNTIASQQQKISTLGSDRKRLLEETSRINRERDNLLVDVQNNSRLLRRMKSQLASRQEELVSRMEELDLTLDQLLQAQTALKTTRAELDQRTQALAASSEALEQSGATLANLENSYGSLKVKYDKLVRPARSSQGKHVVEVRYVKRRGEFAIELKQSSDDGFKLVTREQLDQKLVKLKSEKDLYIKVIIPKNSGLSYSEAWKFTSGLHKNYDYYFQNNDTIE